MRIAACVIAIFALAGCEDTVGDAGSVAYEGPSGLTPSPVAEDSAELDLDGRYGATAADCADDNRYMTEYLDVADGNVTYRGRSTHIVTVRDNEIGLRGGDRLVRQGDTIVRWPDDRSKRTTYTRCTESG